MIIVAIIASYYVGAFLPIIGIISFMLSNKVLSSIKETSRINATTKSPVISLLNESIMGASTIRAFKKQDDFISRNNLLLNNNIKATIMSSGVN